MKNKLTLLLPLLLVCIFTINAQWTQNQQPEGGYCWAVQRVGNEIWAAYKYGIYTSINDGATWTKHPSFADPVYDIETKGDTIVILKQGYTAPNNYRLETVTSYNLGQTWNSPVTAETDNSYYTWGNRDMYVMDNAWIINSNSSNFYNSYDFGQTWNAITFPQTMINISAHSNKHIICYTYNGSSLSNYYTDDGGVTWNFLDSAYVTGNALVIDSTFYFNAGAYIVSTGNLGLSYDTLSANPLNGSSRLSYFNGKIYLSYYNTGPVQYESSDGGITWIASTLPVALFWVEEDHAVSIANGEWLINSRSDGLYRYNSVTGVYYKTETGIKARTVTFLKENKGVLFCKADNVLYTSNDAGTTWVPAPALVKGYGNGSFVFKGDSIFAITSVNNYPKMCYSYDNGTSWDTVQIINGAQWFNPGCLVELNGKLYAGNSDYVAVSNDWGASWDSLSTVTDSVCFGGGMSITHLAVCNNELFCMDDFSGQVSKYDTISQSWKRKLCVFMPGVQYTMFESVDNRLAFLGGGNFYVSSDTGNTWVAPALIGWPSVYKPTSLTSINGIWYAPSNGSLYYSMDFGNQWIQFPTNYDMTVSGVCEEIAASLNNILFAAGNNVWKSNGTLEIISGAVYFDNNNNGIKDAGESGIPGIVMHSQPNNIAFSTDSIGNYAFLTAALGDTLTPSFPTNFCTSNPAYYLTNGSATNVDFGIYFTPGIQDFSADVTNFNAFSPGFNTNIGVTVKNNGTIAIPTQLEVILDSSLIYVNSSAIPSQISGDTLVFDIDTLHILQSEALTIEIQTPFMVPLGTPITCSATINPVSGDTIPADNFSLLTAVVTGPFDPNDKTATCGPYFTPAQLQNEEEVVYIIRFQNTGTAPAQNIHITDTLSGFFQLQDFRIISSSHQMHYTMEGNGIINFYFDNIQLPSSSANEPGSHGFVKFGITCNPALALGDAIDNTSYIYFDFNSPVQTNTSTIIIADPPFNLSTQEIVNVSHLTVYPNPAANSLNGKFDSGEAHSFTLVIYNLLGEPVKSENFNGNRFNLNINNLSKGLYIGRISIEDSEKQIFFRFMLIK